jgi:predicted RNase H-like HicB family nuclease
VKRLQNQLVYFGAQTLRKLGHNFNEEADRRVANMRHAIDALDNHAIQFRVEHYPDGGWSAESTNIDGIMTGSKDPREAPELIKDAIFTYFEIPPQLCHDTLLRSDNEPATVKQTVHIGA